MRAIVISFTLTMFVAAAVAQQAGNQALKTYASSADVAALISKARSERQPNQATVTEPILQFAPYRAMLEYRTAVGPAAIHEREAEVFYVIDGSGTLVTGGKLVGESRSNADNLTGTAIQGGVSRKVAKGDFIVVPETVPHWFSAIDGTLIMMSMHVPRPVPAAH